MQTSIFEVWASGGWVMIPLAGIALASYSIAAYLLFLLRRRVCFHISEVTLRAWLRSPEQGSGEVGTILRFLATGASNQSRVIECFAQWETKVLHPIDRGLFALNVLVAAAPLLGLLGTVMGMLTTFEAMAGGNGTMMGSIAAGISEALITTQTGLLVAIPGYFLASIIGRKRREEEAYIARLESLVTQHYGVRDSGITSENHA